MDSEVIELIYSYNFEKLNESSIANILSFASEEKEKAFKACNSRGLTTNYEPAPATAFGIPAATSKSPEIIANASGTTSNTAQTNSNVFETTSQALGTNSQGARPTYVAPGTTFKAPETTADTRGTVANKFSMGRFYIRTHGK